MSFNHEKALLLLLFFISSISYAQQFGGNPPSVKWSQVNTADVRIIFPQQLDSSATRIANIISYISGPMQRTIGSRQKKISIVLKNQTTISNGFVTLAPFHSEFFLTPLQNSFELGSIPWIEALSVHEFRHVQQFNNFNVGLSKLFHILFGEAGQAFANNVAVPNWFFEGDAVFNETNVTMQGRGRLPFFYNAFRSLWQADRKYSWMKLRNGSYKDFVPDHYPLGYLLVAYGREKYGDEFWKDVTQDAAAFKGLFYPFQKAIKKYSGKNYVQFRTDAMNYFKDKFKPKSEKQKITSSKVINEEYPAFVDEHTIVYVKSSYNKIHSFVIRNGKEEKKIRVKDVSLDNHFSYRNGKLVYASYQPDIRWGSRDYSDLQILDIKTGTQQTLTHHTKYFAPDINDDGSKIVAVGVNADGSSVLQILNTTNGDIVTSVPNPQNVFYTYPKFYGDKIICAVKNGKGQMSLAMINTLNGSADHLTPFSFNVIGFPAVSHDTVYFSAANGEEDKLFACNLINKKLFELIPKNTQIGLGKYQPSAMGNKLVWTTFTAYGYRLQEGNINSVEWKPVDQQYFQQPLSDFEITSLDKTNANLLEKVAGSPLQVTKYSKTTGLINFHSLIPGIDDPEYSVTLIGSNILTTMQTSLAFTYDRAEKWKRIGLGIDYAALFPFISAGVDYTIDRRGRYHGKTVYWNELEPRGGISIPLNLSKGRSLTFMNIGSNYVYNQSNFKGAYKDTLGKISYSYLSNLFTITNQVQKARQNIYPRFAQTLSLGYKTALTKYNSSQFVANANLYLPGFLTNHNIVFNAAYLKKDTIGQLNFSSGFPFSRGYQSENLHEMIKWGANYHLPLLYPDAGFANIIYLLRLRANLFYDHTHVNDFYTNGNPFTANFRSTGAELYFDTKWWNEASVTFGIRYSYLLDKDLFGATGKNRWELILPVNLFDQ
ncbi:MAG: hypothetical protein JWO92_1923 [Chitinophagaceae bacterium]|nr:hypothetical protein [Chitinophagaceae bacterium]